MCLGIPGEIVAVRDERGVRFGTVRFGGITRDVCLACVPEAGPGDYVLVHVGFAISTIDADEAARSYRILAELGEADAQRAGGAAKEPTRS
jgi:hydrogenase expression/formation protein HypC